MLPARPRRPGTRAAAPRRRRSRPPASSRSGRRAERAAQRRRPPPAGDPGVVAASEHLGHRPAPELGRPGVLRVLEQPGRERLLGARRLVAHAPRAPAGPPPRSRPAPPPRRRRARSRRPTARRRRGGRRPAGRRPRSDRTAARTRRRRRARRRTAWSKRRPAGRQQEQRARRRRPPRPRRRAAPGAITMPAPPPNGRVVDAAVAVGGVLAQVVHAAGRGDPAARAWPSSDASSGPARYSGKIVKTSMRTAPSAQRSSSPSGGSITTTPSRCSTTNTIGTSAPPSSTSRSCAGFASTATTRPSGAPARSTHLGADHLVHPELVVVELDVVGERLGGELDARAAPRPRCGRRRPSKRTSHRPWCGRDARDHELAVAGEEHRAGRERSGRLLVKRDGDLAAQPVGPADASDLEPVARTGHRHVGRATRRCRRWP